MVTTKHVPSEKFMSGEALAISVNVASTSPRRVTLHYRHVNQAERWQSVEMKGDGHVFTGGIPSDYSGKSLCLAVLF